MFSIQNYYIECAFECQGCNFAGHHFNSRHLLNLSFHVLSSESQTAHEQQRGALTALQPYKDVSIVSASLSTRIILTKFENSVISFNRQASEELFLLFYIGYAKETSLTCVSQKANPGLQYLAS